MGGKRQEGKKADVRFLIWVTGLKVVFFNEMKHKRRNIQSNVIYRFHIRKFIYLLKFTCNLKIYMCGSLIVIYEGIQTGGNLSFHIFLAEVK